MLSARRRPSAKPASVPTTPIEAPVIRKTRMIAPRVAPMVRRIAMSLDLSFTSMIRPGDDVERRDQHDQRQDEEHDVPLDLERGEEGAVALAPVGEQDRPLGRLLDRRARLVDPVGVVEEDLDDVHVAVAVEVGLRLGERHVDEGRVELRHADLEDGDDRIALDARRGAEGRRRAARA